MQGHRPRSAIAHASEQSPAGQPKRRDPLSCSSDKINRADESNGPERHRSAGKPSAGICPGIAYRRDSHFDHKRYPPA